MDLARNLIQRINVGDSLTRSAAARPAQLAVVDAGRRWTYAEFNGWVNQVAHGLAGRGYARGDALGLASGNSAEFLAVYYACAKLGVVCVPVNLGWRADEIAYVLDHSGARGLAVEAQLTGQVRDAIVKVAAVADVIVLPGTGAAHQAEPADRAWVTLAALAATPGTAAEPECVVDDRDALSYLYTSGTTSFPKGVVGTHVAIYTESMSSALDSQWNHTDRFAAMMPMFHTAQLNAFCTPAILVGATIHVMRGFDPTALFGQTEMSPVTTLFRPEHQLSHIGAVGTRSPGCRSRSWARTGPCCRPGSRARSSTAAPARWPGTCTTRPPPRRPSRTAGSTPGTWAPSATTACCGSPTGTRT